MLPTVCDHCGSVLPDEGEGATSVCLDCGAVRLAIVPSQDSFVPAAIPLELVSVKAEITPPSSVELPVPAPSEQSDLVEMQDDSVVSEVELFDEPILLPLKPVAKAPRRVAKRSGSNAPLWFLGCVVSLALAALFLAIRYVQEHQNSVVADQQLPAQHYVVNHPVNPDPFLRPENGADPFAGGGAWNPPRDVQRVGLRPVAPAARYTFSDGDDYSYRIRIENFDRKDLWTCDYKVLRRNLDPDLTASVGNAVGSGFIISTEGHLLTTNRLVENASHILVELDEQNFQAEVIRRDPEKDLALLKIKSPNPTPVVWGEIERIPFGTNMEVLGFATNEGQKFPWRPVQVTMTRAITEGGYRHFALDGRNQVPSSYDGSPFTNPRGEVCGLVRVSPMNSGNRTAATGISLAAIDDFLRSDHIQLSKSHTSTEPIRLQNSVARIQVQRRAGDEPETELLCKSECRTIPEKQPGKRKEKTKPNQCSFRLSPKETALVRVNEAGVVNFYDADGRMILCLPSPALVALVELPRAGQNRCSREIDTNITEATDDEQVSYFQNRRPADGNSHPAVERTVCEFLREEDGKAYYSHTYQVRTLEEGRIPFANLMLTGEVTHDLTRGVLSSSHYNCHLTLATGKTNPMNFQFQMKVDLLSADEIALQKQADEEEREKKELAARIAAKPLTEEEREQVLADLRSADPERCRVALRLVAPKSPLEPDLEMSTAIAEQLQGPEEIPVLALLALKHWITPETVPELLPVMETWDKENLRPMMELLVEIKDRRTYPVLIAQLAHWSKKFPAGDTLRRIGVDAEEAMLEELHTSNEQLALELLTVLPAIGREHSIAAVQSYLKEAPPALTERLQTALTELQNAQQDRIPQPPLITEGQPVEDISTLTVGQEIQSRWAGVWWRARILEIGRLTDPTTKQEADKIRVHFIGWGVEFDRDVSRDQIRGLEEG